MQVNNINFYGYKNTFSFDIKGDNTNMAYLSAELTNEGEKDLAKYHELLAMKNLPKTNVINCFYTKVNGKDLFLMNGEVLPNDEKLKDMQKTLKDYDSQEKFVLKAYTLIANITRRMSANDLVTIDSNFRNVMYSVIKNMRFIFDDEKTVKDLIVLGTYKNLPIGKCASILNSVIQKNMERFFK